MPVTPATPASRSLAELAQILVRSAVHAQCRGDGHLLSHCRAQLRAHQEPAWRHAVEQVLLHDLLAALDALWKHGWQPVDLLRLTTRRLKAPHEDLLRAGVAAHLSTFAPATVDQRWHDQLASAGITVWWPPDQTAVQACSERHPAGWADFAILAVELLHHLSHLPSLEMLTPAPGTAPPPTARRLDGVDERVLARVRALLAKAESTNYPAEAETFTAGAQALMARHAIDHALLAATGRAPADEPTARRIGVDNPYESPKATLLSAIASANRSRAVWHKNLGFTTVVGYPADLDAVEVLFTSLLVQAVSAMTREGSRTDHAGGSRTRSFRQSFLISYAHRIRERLSATNREQTEAAASESGAENLLPVLASRTEAVDRATTAMFPSVVTSSAGAAWDEEGWAVGRAAADLAALTPQAPLPS
jgi:hypothetical protein